MTAPQQTFIRRNVLFEWLKSEGISEYAVKRLIKDGTIERVKWRGEEKSKYLYITNSAKCAIAQLKSNGKL